MRSNQSGFTLIELMIVIAIIGILSTMALPSYQDRVIRAQASEGMALAEFVKQSVAAHYARTRAMPRDNAAAGLPDSELIVGNYVSKVQVRGGAIDITFGNRTNKFLGGKVLTLRPAVVPGHPVVPIAWVCGNASVPERMSIMGDNATNLPASHLPIDCRS
jgi:type IV pilus assembly protein PilA